MLGLHLNNLKSAGVYGCMSRLELRRSWQNLILIASLSSFVGQLLADEKGEPVADGPWISSVAWHGDAAIVGTRSQGLLFRPAEVVQASPTNPADLKVVGESPTSLWGVVSAGTGAIVSDYKGGVHEFKTDGDKPSEPKSFELDARWIRTLEKAPKSEEVLAGTEDGKLLVLALDKHQELRRVDAAAAAIFDIAFSAAGDKVATAAGDGSIHLFSWPALESLGTMKAGGDAIWALTFVDNDQQIVSGGADRAVQLWDVAKRSSIVTMASARNWVTSLVAIPKTNFVAAGCMDGQVVIVDYKRMLAVADQAVAESAIWSMALSPSGKQVAIGTRKHGLMVSKIQPWRRAARQAANKIETVRPPAPKR